VFSKGTFKRYLHEIEATQARLEELYHKAAEQDFAPDEQRMARQAIEEIEREMEAVHTIQKALDEVAS
jgi:RNA polymerase-interacting CarD/CdnL/TRCF family regulator